MGTFAPLVYHDGRAGARIIASSMEVTPLAKKKIAPKEQIGVIYARYSSHSQKDASIEQQIRECLAYARAQNIHIVASYEDRAVSGKTDRRAEFQRMMKDAEKGNFQYVIAWKSNRMGRNMLQAMMNEAGSMTWVYGSCTRKKISTTPPPALCAPKHDECQPVLQREHG